MDPSSDAQVDRVTVSAATKVLTNPLLLPLIFEHMPRPSAIRLRRVNKSWNEAARPVLKEKALYISIRPRDAIRTRRIHQFVAYLRSSPTFPFTKLSVEVTPQLNGSLWNALLQNAAPFLTQLRVRGGGRQADLNLDPSLPPDIRLPELKFLKIHLDPNADAARDPPRFLSGIVAASPQLQSLELRNVGIRVLHQLTHQRPLQLAKLSLDLVYDDYAFYDDVANFLITQRDSLVELRIYANYVRTFVAVGMSYSLPHVKALRLDDYEEEMVEDDYHRLEFANKFPALEKVHLKSYKENCNCGDFLAFNTGVPSTSVTALRLGHLTQEKCQEAMVKYVPALFPNLTCLSVTAGFKNVVRLVGKLEHLETLTLEWSPEMGETADSIFCGLDTPDWHRQGRLSRQPFGLVKDFRRMMDQKPYSAWHKIRSLKFMFDRNSRFPVSEATCRLVLLQMRNLKEVHFKGRQPNENEISPAVMKQMKAKFEVFVPRNFCC